MSDQKVPSDVFASAAAAGPELRTGRPAAAVAIVSEGAGLGNTHPPTSQIVLSGFPQYRAAGGFDWLEWAAVVNWASAIFSRIFGKLQAAKSRCKQDQVPDVWIDLPNNGPIRVSRLGLNRGGDRGQHFEFKVCYNGVWIGLARRKSGSSKLPNVYVCQRGRDCLLRGAMEGYAEVREFLGRLGAEFVADFISRADWCMDIAGLNVTELQIPVEQRCFISRVRKVRPYLELVANCRTGFSVGASPLYLVVYDKLLEQIATNDQLYFQALIQRRCGGVLPEYLTRLELQVLRKRLREFGINSVPDLIDRAGVVVDWAMMEWFRLTTEPVDRKNNHQSRAEVLALWTSIREAFVKIFGQPFGPLVPLDREKVKPHKLFRMSRGTGAKALRQQGTKPESYNDFIFSMMQGLYEIAPTQEEQAKFLADYHRRLTEDAA